ncbi:MAG: hypothetical protein HYU58_18245 [Proteobacteria bacterium]|nr:hypothetical protein [Pseudomonadota bacterium]
MENLGKTPLSMMQFAPVRTGLAITFIVAPAFAMLFFLLLYMLNGRALSSFAERVLPLTRLVTDLPVSIGQASQSIKLDNHALYGMVLFVCLASMLTQALIQCLNIILYRKFIVSWIRYKYGEDMSSFLARVWGVWLFSSAFVLAAIIDLAFVGTTENLLQYRFFDDMPISAPLLMFRAGCYFTIILALQNVAITYGLFGLLTLRSEES